MNKYEVTITHTDSDHKKVVTHKLYPLIDDDCFKIHGFIEDVEAEAAHQAIGEHMTRYRVRKGDILQVDNIEFVEPIGD